VKHWLTTLRAVPTLLRVGFADAVAYRAEFLVWVLAYTMPVIMLALWSAVAAEAPLGRFGEREFEAYFFVTLLVRLTTGAWVVWEMNTEVRLGTLQTRLLRPLHPLLAYLLENIAALPMRVVMAVPIGIAFVLAFGPVSLHPDAFTFFCCQSRWSGPSCLRSCRWLASAPCRCSGRARSRRTTSGLVSTRCSPAT
jgi:ABC-2 type transport system permease protein